MSIALLACMLALCLINPLLFKLMSVMMSTANIQCDATLIILMLFVAVHCHYEINQKLSCYNYMTIFEYENHFFTVIVWKM